MADPPPAPWIGSVAPESVLWPGVRGTQQAAEWHNAPIDSWFLPKYAHLPHPVVPDENIGGMLTQLSATLRQRLDAVPPTPPPRRTRPGERQDNSRLKTYRTRLRPNTQQMEALRKTAGIVRWTYNRAVEYLKAHPNASFHDVREHSVTEDGLPLMNLSWVTPVLYSIREQAFFDAHTALRNGLADVRAGEIPNFELKFRKKRALFSSFRIRTRDWDGGCLKIPNFSLGPGQHQTKIQTGIDVPSLEHDGACIKQENRSWFLLWQKDMGEQKMRVPAARGPEMCAIDPGVRTFATIYDPLRGTAAKFGDGDHKRLFRLDTHLDELISGSTQASAKKKCYRMRRAANRLRARIRHLVDELHWKLRSYLKRSFDTVLLPKFNAHQMSRRGQRRIGRKTVRAMMTWAHGRFRSRLNEAMEVV
ncbi:unnamed protein product [Tilletia laevis]|nr:unnamed protein product [Tilletia laevis]